MEPNVIGQMMVKKNKDDRGMKSNSFDNQSSALKAKSQSSSFENEEEEKKRSFILEKERKHRN
jgi:hypothetical protein